MEDRFLVWRLRRGSTDALRRLYEKYRLDLLRVACGLAREKSEAEDAVHDVFLGFVEGIADFRLTGSLKAYLLVCVVNKCRKLNRARKNHEAVELQPDLPLLATGRRPEEWAVLNEDFSRLRLALAEIPQEQKETVLLHLQGGMKFNDIAAAQGESIKTVISRYRYGLAKLQTLLSDGREK